MTRNALNDFNILANKPQKMPNFDVKNGTDMLLIVKESIQKWGFQMR